MRKQCILAFLLAFLLALAATLAAQTPTSVPIGKAFTLAWDYVASPEVGPVEAFRVELNGSQVGGDIEPGTFTFQMPLASTCTGIQTLRVGAYGSGKVTWSSPLTFQITGCPPGAPSNLRLIIEAPIAADGKVGQPTLRIVSEVIR